jgi:hypothetical protein
MSLAFFSSLGSSSSTLSPFIRLTGPDTLIAPATSLVLLVIGVATQFSPGEAFLTVKRNPAFPDYRQLLHQLTFSRNHFVRRAWKPVVFNDLINPLI